MTTKTNPVNDIPQAFADLTDTLKGEGAWCFTVGGGSTFHYYISRNPKSSMAISLCAVKVIPAKSLQLAKPVIKCLVCEAYHTAREEVKLKHEKKLTMISVARQVQLDLKSPQTTEQE